jgi:hypothetical protein
MDDANPRSGGRGLTPPSLCLLARLAFSASAAVGLRSASRPYAGHCRGLNRHCVIVSALRRRDADRAAGRHTKWSGDRVLRGNLQEQ